MKINHLKYLINAEQILIQHLSSFITKSELSETLSQFLIEFINGVRLYVRYNAFGEYGYQILVYDRKIPFYRFDNFDDHWNISTKPHHLHIGDEPAIDSPMVGDPEKDMIELIDFLKKTVL